MNAIQIDNRIELYLDATRNARYQRVEKSAAVNDAIKKFIDDRFGDEANRNPYSFQFIQQDRDDLYTLIKSATPTVTNLTAITTDYYTTGVSRITNPTDYYTLISWNTTVAGIQTFARPITYNELGPLLEDSLKYPTNKRTYYLEDATGYKFYRGTTGTMTVGIEYIKTPATYSMGTDAQLIDAGVGVLTIGLSYIATEVSVQNSVTYQPGTQFTAAVSTTLTSGQVILASNTTTCDLPDKVHEIIAKMAADILSGVVSDYTRAQSIEKQVKES